MTLPGQSFSFIDPGIPRSGVDASVIPLCIGTCAQGSTTAIKTFTRPADALTEYGRGPLSTLIALILIYGGRPVRGLRIATATAGAQSAVTKTGSATGDATLSGNALDRFSVRVETVTLGALGTATVRYTLDRWGDDNIPVTWSQPIAVPGSGIVAIPGTGVTITFDDALDAATSYDFTTTPPVGDATGIAGTAAVIQASQLPFRFIALAGLQSETASVAAALATALGTLADTTLTGVFKHTRALLDLSGDTDSNVAAGAYVTTLQNRRVAGFYGEGQIVGAPLPLVGLGYPRITVSDMVAARAAANLISTDPIRVASGPLPFQNLSHDEYVEESLDSLRVGTARTYPGLRGYYATNAWLKSAPDSDFQYLQHGMLMDLACDIVYQKQAGYIGATLRTNSDGTILEEDARDIEADITDALRVALLDPLNAEGKPGHVSALEYTIRRDTNVLADGALVSDLGIQPNLYPRQLTTTFGFRVIAV